MKEYLHRINTFKRHFRHLIFSSLDHLSIIKLNNEYILEKKERIYPNKLLIVVYRWNEMIDSIIKILSLKRKETK